MSDASEAPVTHYDATGNPINNCAHDWQRRASNFDNSGTARRKRELGAAQSYLWQAERDYELLRRRQCEESPTLADLVERDARRPVGWRAIDGYPSFSPANAGRTEGGGVGSALQSKPTPNPIEDSN